MLVAVGAALAFSAMLCLSLPVPLVDTLSSHFAWNEGAIGAQHTGK